MEESKHNSSHSNPLHCNGVDGEGQSPPPLRPSKQTVVTIEEAAG